MKAGFGKSKINYSPGKKGTVLLGYMNFQNKASQIESELHARCILMIGEMNNPVFSLCIETCFVSAQLKLDIAAHFEKSNFPYKPTLKNLMLHAQNTHAAPGGFSSYLFQNLFSGGFNEAFYQSLLLACIEAIKQAIENIQEAKIILNVSEFEQDKHVAFNRSLKAYNENKDVNPLQESQTNEAISRWVKQLKFISMDGTTLGIVNWFGVHGNSVGWENKSICADNKGYASAIFEKENSHIPNFTAIFAQEACADVSPNYHGNAFRWPRGKYEDQFKSAYFNGYIQYEKASEMLNKSDVDIPVKGVIKSEHAYFDFSNYTINEKFASTDELRVGYPCVGISAVKGTAIDTPGIGNTTALFVSIWIKFRKLVNSIPGINRRKKITYLDRRDRIHGNKEIVADLFKKRFIGLRNVNLIPHIEPFHDLLGVLKKAYQNRITLKYDWWPTILELQYFQVGSLLIIGVPGDITTQAAFRLKQSILDASDHEFIDVIINSYANDYCGYICTPEEYDKQLYEGGFTVYGRETLAAFQTAFCELIKGSKQSSIKNKKPVHLSPEELKEMNLNT